MIAPTHRAAAAGGRSCHALLALGGDVPPELAKRDLTGFPRVLIGRGATDPWYGEEKLVADVDLLRSRGVSVEICAFDGGHEWSDAFCRASADRLSSL